MKKSDIEYAIGYIVVEQQLPDGRWIGHIVMPRYPSDNVERVVVANAGWGCRHRYVLLGLAEGDRIREALSRGEYKSIMEGRGNYREIYVNKYGKRDS